MPLTQFELAMLAMNAAMHALQLASSLAAVAAQSAELTTEQAAALDAKQAELMASSHWTVRPDPV